MSARLTRVGAAVGGELLGLLPMLGVLSVVFGRGFGIFLVFILAAISAAAIPSTVIAAFLGFSASLRSHIVLGASLPILSYLGLFIGSIGAPVRDNSARPIGVAMLIIAFCTCCVEAGISQIERGHERRPPAR